MADVIATVLNVQRWLSKVIADKDIYRPDCLGTHTDVF